MDCNEIQSRGHSRDRLGRRRNSATLGGSSARSKADAALIASMVHYGTYTIAGIKAEMEKAGIPVR
jgi:hypothetical protein